MGEFISVGRVDEVGEGAVKAFPVMGVEIAIARSGGTLYAFSDICTHRRCNLSMGGEIDGEEITCECHGSVFSMATGEVIEGPAEEAIETYPVRVQDDQIQIEA
jgi:nitrite reductase/ring-hydroxylating ferredoxin subunit